jgi:hypothetical protein
MEMLNFTFNVTKYEQDSMSVKLDFTSPTEISPLAKQDTLVFHIKEKGLNFISKTYLVDLHDNYTTLTRPIKKQMIDDTLSNGMVLVTSGIKEGMVASVVAALVLNIFIQGAL